MDPIIRVGTVRSGLAPVSSVPALDRVQREEPRPDEQERRRRPKRLTPPESGVQRDADGQLHVDVQA